MLRSLWVVIGAWLALILTSGARAESLQVVASVRPAALLVQELTAELPVSVTTLLPRGATPHDYALKPSDLRTLVNADLVVWLGDDSEPYLKPVIRKAGRAIQWEELGAVERLSLRELQRGDRVHGDRVHGDHDQAHHGHDHPAMHFDPHLWLGVDNALALAAALQDALQLALPQHSQQIARNRAALAQRLQQQRQQVQAALAESPPFMLSHDAYQYLEQDLEIASVGAVNLDPEIKPGVKHLMALKQLLQARDVQCVLVDPTVSSALLDKLDRSPPLHRAAIDPLGWDFNGEHYSLWLAQIYQKVKGCLLQP